MRTDGGKKQVGNVRVIAWAMVWFCVTGLAAPGTEWVLEFTGNNSYIELGTPGALQIPSGEPFTVEGWMYFHSLSSRDMLYSKDRDRTSSSGHYSYMLGFYDNGKLAAYDGGSWREPSPSETVNTEQWYHVAYSFDGSTMSYYIDSELKGTSSFSFNNNPDHTVKIGGYHDGSDTDGMKSDVRVWDHARGQEDIQLFMNTRLTGAETGLLGYWPLNEGSGDTVGDGTAYNTEGTVINAEWVIDEDLLLTLPGADFLPALPFTLADQETGSTEFTNSNEVDIVDFPIPEDYDLFQITESGESQSLGAWTSTSAVPGDVVYTQPTADTNVTLFAWFTNSTDEVTLLRAPGNIYYTEVLPVLEVRAALTIERLPDQNVVIYPEHLDIGSSGGTADDRDMEVHDRWLVWVSGPLGTSDLTPDDPYITVDAEGVYELRLGLQNEAGNTNVSAICEVTVTGYSGVNSWTDMGATDLWSDPANWSAGVPLTGQDVEITSGTMLLTEPTAELNSFTMTGGTMTYSNWMTRLWATDVTVSGGSMTLPLHYVDSTLSLTFTDIQMSNRVWVVCENFTLGSGASINALGRGYNSGYGPGSQRGGAYSPGGGHGGIGGNSRGNHGWPMYGPVYGSLEAPKAPGSGAGRMYDGGRGGGAVFIDATGQVTIEGEIDAGGVRQRNNQSGGGSGGSIYIRCNTFAGSSSGLLDVGGGSGPYSSGDGAGGRIAVVYDSAAQQALETVNPGVRFRSTPGGGGSRSHRAEPGTLFLPDTLFLDGDVIGAEFLDVNVFIPGFTNWVTAGDATVLGRASFPEWRSVTIGGNLTLASSARMRVFGGDTNTTGNAYYGMPFKVAGELAIESGATLETTLYAFNALFTNDVGRAPAWFQVRRLTIEDGGTLLAPTLQGGSGYGPASGPGAGGYDTTSGGGYGGAGAGSSPGQPYGFAQAPLLPGSGGGHSLRGGRGGGLILVSATDRVRIDGLIRANGCQGNYHSGENGGSGGAIMISCRRFEGQGGTLEANGHSVLGGGGRVAVWIPRLPLDYKASMADGYMPVASTSLLAHDDPESDIPDFDGQAAVQWHEFEGTVSVTGDVGRGAEPGTAFFGQIFPGTLMMVR